MHTRFDKLTLVATQIAAAAILMEAGRMAGNNASSPNDITPDKVKKAMETYQEILEAIREHEE